MFNLLPFICKYFEQSINKILNMNECLNFVLLKYMLKKLCCNVSILKFRKTNFAFFKHDHLKCLFVSLYCIYLITVSTPKFNFATFGCH